MVSPCIVDDLVRFSSGGERPISSAAAFPVRRPRVQRRPRDMQYVQEPDARISHLRRRSLIISLSKAWLDRVHNSEIWVRVSRDLPTRRTCFSFPHSGVVVLAALFTAIGSDAGVAPVYYSRECQLPFALVFLSGLRLTSRRDRRNVDPSEATKSATNQPNNSSQLHQDDGALLTIFFLWS